MTARPARWIARHPASTYVLAGLILYALVFATGAAYDSGGAGGALFWASRLFGGFFWAVAEIAFRLNGGKAPPLHDIAVPLVSVICAFLLDRAIGGLVLRSSLGAEPEARATRKLP